MSSSRFVTPFRVRPFSNNIEINPGRHGHKHGWVSVSKCRIHTLPHLKCIRFVFVRLTPTQNALGWFPCVQVNPHLKCIYVRSSLPCTNIGMRIELT